ncbi:GDP-mannose 4,6-dehydratase [Acidimicrobiia bacterium]|jgi:GDPmannose 4,6-dehydratase|nr:GDP-mannose 4,6-dehydratase [Acidimicrobiia bacterium]
MKKAFVTGITGQDGYYLSNLLIEKGYQVHGTIRRSSTFNTSRIESLMSKYSEDKLINLYYSDLLDPSSLNGLIQTIEPDEVYNLAAQSHVAVSFKNPQFSISTSTAGPVSLLDSIKNANSDIKYYQASSSEMYGGGTEEFLNEESLFDPKSPYAAGKVFAHNMTKIYRDSYELFCVNGILFNHESPLRGETFVTRKITRALGRIHHGIQDKLYLGNLDAVRDWGFAGDYVEAMWMMMQHDKPNDWVVSTGEAHSVKEFLEESFSIVGLNWKDYVEVDEKYLRPNEVKHLLGDSTKIRKELKWSPKVSFKELTKMMVESDLNLAEQEKVLLDKKLISKTWEG